MFPVSVLKMTTSPLYHQMETLEFHFKIVWVILGLPGQNLGWPRSWGCSCEPGHPLPALEASLLRYGDCGWQTLVFKLGFPGSSAGKESTCNAGDPRFNSWVRKIPLRRDRLPTLVFLGFPGDSDGKELVCSVGDKGSIAGLRRSPGGGHGKLFQYCCLENPHGQRSLEGYSPWGRKELDTTKQSTKRGTAQFSG